MKQILKLFSYYLLLIIGLIMTSWLIWSRFIRERTIKNIPDYLLTEYRVWILLYICFIYLLVIKNIIKPTKNSILSQIAEEITLYIYKPLITLDHFVKYNKFTKPYYYKLVINFAQKFYKIQFYQVHIFIFIMQVFPRIILLSFLLIDVFHFNKIETFYKVIFIGLLPFILRYLKYSLKDIYKHWVTELEENYQCVEVSEKCYEYDKDDFMEIRTTNVTGSKNIKEYIELKFNNIYDYADDNIKYQYEAYPHLKNDMLLLYTREKYCRLSYTYLRSYDFEYLDKLYHDLMPNIIYLKQYFFRLEIIDDKETIKWSKIVIFSLYVLCWSFVLILSYGHFPIELNGMKYLILNFDRYLICIDNPFAELYWGSLSDNLITYDNIKHILVNLIKMIILKFS